ncbi:MAG: universal stress protein [Deltaproteobacteria bacterium]|nr:universal stress protein [Deltaproteobacteria bacterium]
MKKRILVAVGDCIYSEHAVKYVARISSAAKDLTYTLFNVQPMVPRIFSAAAEKDSTVKAEIDKLIRENTKTARCTVERLKDIIVREGIAEEYVEVVTETMQVGMSKDILNRAEQGGYDAIVIARRGLTPSRDFFIGTIAAKVVEHALRTPVWVVAGEDISMNFMVAVDGSENSLRVVDHVIQMVGAHPDLRLTLFHVLPYLRHYYSPRFETENPKLHEILQREDKTRMEDFYGKARERLKAAGLKMSQIKIKTSRQSHDISTGILGEARTGRYDTVVVGRRGEREAFFTGRIAIRLVQKITDQTLWVVP